MTTFQAGRDDGLVPFEDVESEERTGADDVESSTDANIRESDSTIIRLAATSSRKPIERASDIHAAPQP
jgi:hypothetical protein